MSRLAAERRFEQADLTRQHLEALTTTISSRRRLEQLVRCPRMVLRLSTGQFVELRRGVLWSIWEAPGRDTSDPIRPYRWRTSKPRAVEMPPPSLPDPEDPVGMGLADELNAVASWLERHADSVVIEFADGVYASDLPALGSFAPTPRVAA